MVRQINERRQYIRISSKHLMEAEKFSLRQMDLKKEIDAVTKNFSSGGMLFESKKQFELQDTLKLQVKLPGWGKYKTEFIKPDRLSKSEPLIILAKVVRVEIVKVQRLYDIGVCFVGIDRDHKKALKKYIEKELIK